MIKKLATWMWVSVGLAAVLACGPAAHAAPNDVSLEWRPAFQTVEVGDVVELGLYVVAGDEPDQSVWVVEAILLWQADKLELLGLNDNGPYPWLGSYFPDESGLDGLNAPFSNGDPFVPANDGDAWYNALRQLPTQGGPAEATPEGLLVTTFLFRAAAAGTSFVEIPPNYGQHTLSRVLPGDPYEGTLGPPAAIEAISLPIPAVSEWGLVVAGLLLLTVGTLAFADRRTAPNVLAEGILQKTEARSRCAGRLR